MFGGDFDGDQMAIFLVPKDHETEVVGKMSPTNLKFYDKNLRPITTPSHGVINYSVTFRSNSVDKTLLIAGNS